MCVCVPIVKKFRDILVSLTSPNVLQLFSHHNEKERIWSDFGRPEDSISLHRDVLSLA